jgi:excisionase family DNA binding protein
MVINLALTEQDRKAVQAALPAVRRASPEAATVISRLLRAAAVIEDPAVRPYASVREVARAFSVTDQTIRNWVDRGWLPADRRFGRGPRRIPRSVLASAGALSRPRPPTRFFAPDETEAILTRPRRVAAK